MRKPCECCNRSILFGTYIVNQFPLLKERIIRDRRRQGGGHCDGRD